MWSFSLFIELQLFFHIWYSCCLFHNSAVFPFFSIIKCYVLGYLELLSYFLTHIFVIRKFICCLKTLFYINNNVVLLKQLLIRSKAVLLYPRMVYRDHATCSNSFILQLLLQNAWWISSTPDSHFQHMMPLCILI